MSTPKPNNTVYSLAMFGLVSILCGVLLAGLAVPMTALAGGATKLVADSIQYLPAELETPPQSERSRVLMADGSELATFFEENREYKPLDQIAKNMQKAQVAIEDHRFYEHGAIDIQGLGRAIVKTITGDTQGASTLTQQYVKQVQIESAKVRDDKTGVRAAQTPTLERKIREMRYAMAVEERLTKDQILERYLNIAYYGDGAYGVEAAAKHYWNTSAENLTLDQAAMLAGIVQNPDAYNPVKYPQKAIERRNQVLNRMASPAVGFITKEEAEAAKQVGFDASQVQSTVNGCTVSRFPTLCQYVYNVLISDQMPSLGSTPRERANTLKRGGLTIHTLINPEAQQAAEDAVASTVGPTDPVWGGAVLLQPSTGLIVAMAQSRPKLGDGEGETWKLINAEEKYGGIEGFQAGSTFKPFVVATALNAGVAPTLQLNSPMKLPTNGMEFRGCDGPFRLHEGWEPQNYDRDYGTIDMKTATENSVNTYFVQLEAKVGLCDSIDMAQKLGVKRADGEDMRKDGSVASWVLGTSYVTPLSMAEAYATFANRGTHCNPIILRLIQTKEGQDVPVPSANCQEVLSPEVADGVNNILSGVVTRGTGQAARMPDGRPQAGKTGTTDSNRSVWFAGYTPDMAGATFIAVDNTAPEFKGRPDAGIKYMRLSTGVRLQGSGSGDAGPIWKRAMSAALKDVDPTPFGKVSQRIEQGETVQVPDTNGMSPQEARTTLEAAGFSTVNVEVDSPRPKGTFLGVSPSTTAPKFSTIQLLFSKGQQPTPEPSVVPPTPGAPPDPGIPAPIEPGPPGDQ